MKSQLIYSTFFWSVAFVFLFQCSPFDCLAQKSKEVKSILDEIISHAEESSLYRDGVDWNSVKQEMYALAEEADSISQLKPALELMLNELNDTHGRVFHNNQYLAYHTGNRPSRPDGFDWDVYTDIQSAQVYPFIAENLENEIGYVRIVGLPMGDNQKMSNDIQDAVCEIIKNGATKWIIDLRYNGGGNMFPMVEGLTSIIGDGPVGGTKGVTEEESSVWKIEDGDFYYDEQNVAIDNRCPLEELPKIAVLTSSYTASSGEALAVILKGRPDTRFFGNNSYGMITATDYHPIDKSTVMSISVSYYKDRSGKVYTTNVDVDEEIRFVPAASLPSDLAVAAAKNWLIR
ncbi:S41 family peptidase [Cryomorphaceae bacterium 1068]|nr:S41 family peptidase [Cryomorphaceae bacterium 1068]